MPARKTHPETYFKPKSKHRKAVKGKNTPKDIGVTKRMLEALALREQGHTFAEIGRRLEPRCNAATVSYLLTTAHDRMRAVIDEKVEHIRALELRRLDSMLVGLYPAATKGDPRAVEVALKIAIRRAELQGLDAPTKQEHSGPNGGPIPIARVERVIVDPGALPKPSTAS